MKTIFLVPFALLAAAMPGEVDSVCDQGLCRFLAIKRGSVHYIETERAHQNPTRDLVLGALLRQTFVPTTEAPIRVLRAGRGWRVVMSAFLNHDERQPGLRVRFISPGGKPCGTSDVLAALDEAVLGHLFGGEQLVFAVTTEWEHSYNVSTEIWLLQEPANAEQVLALPGSLDHFVANDAGVPGVWISVDTYDGQNASTKGRKLLFWQWDAKNRKLTPRDE